LLIPTATVVTPSASSGFLASVRSPESADVPEDVRNIRYLMATNRRGYKRKQANK